MADDDCRVRGSIYLIASTGIFNEWGGFVFNRQLMNISFHEWKSLQEINFRLGNLHPLGYYDIIFDITQEVSIRDTYHVFSAKISVTMPAIFGVFIPYSANGKYVAKDLRRRWGPNTRLR